MIVKVNCESDRIESPDAVAALFVHGALIGTPRAVINNQGAQNNITYVFELLYPEAALRLIGDAWKFCELRGQDCIAVRLDTGGELLGPRAKKWLPFNPAYFIE
jgi:hypothetical protein